MIDWTFQHQKEVSVKSRSYISPLALAKEFCTVKFCLPRQSGHTTFAKKLMKSRSCVYVTQEQYGRRILNELEPKYKRRVSWLDNLNKLRGLTFDIFIVDVSSMLSNKQIEKIYDFCKGYAKSQDLCILFLE
jgi:hypothetical protein